MAKNNILNPYSNFLDAPKIVEGMNCAIQNANRLLKDAKLLFELDRYPSALSLAILCIEESGKVSILRKIASCTNIEQLNDAWRDFRNHRSKNAAWIFKDLFYKGARNLDDFLACVDKRGDHTEVLDKLKQVGLYTDCLADKHWSLPEAIIDKAQCESILKIANLLIPKKEITLLEVELWIKHLKNNQNSKEALINWYEDMILYGLLDDDLDNFSKFVYDN